MLNDLSSTIRLLLTRRSAKPRHLVEPGPSAGQLRTIFEAALRSPDHGKLHPWRFVHVARERRLALAELLDAAMRAEQPGATRLEFEANRQFAHQAPELIVALSSPTEGHKIPVWEQQLSCGAACMNLVLAAHALGFAAGWVTGWAAYSPQVLAAFGVPGERIAGFLFLGTPASPLEERVRPGFDEVVSEF
ncbi:MAG: nitroreductase family protein [Sphingosinicella sp.]